MRLGVRSPLFSMLYNLMMDVLSMMIDEVVTGGQSFSALISEHSCVMVTYLLFAVDIPVYI